MTGGGAVKKRIMIYCQPVLGIGHLVRSLEIVRALVDFDVFFVNGGALPPLVDFPRNAELINLPPMQSDPEFRDIGPIDAAAGIEEVKKERTRRLLDVFAGIEPDILLIELFPFGRLKFDFELRPLLDAARIAQRRPVVACSLRDILVRKRDQQSYEDFVIRTVNRYFDLILVHSDPGFQKLEETFPRLGELKCSIEYTGYVARRDQADDAPSPRPAAGGVKSIVASIGGGRVGIELLRCAVEASLQMAPRLAHRLVVFTGPYLPDADCHALQALCSGHPHITVSRFAGDFLSVLRHADLSISMAGYNTCMDIIAAGIPAIVCPFTGNDNREQTIRAAKLKQAGILEIIEGPALSPAALAGMIERQLNLPGNARPRVSLDVNGAAQTARLLRLYAAGGKR